MKQAFWLGLAVALLIAPDFARAQAPNAGRRSTYVRPSTVSPYLDLLNGRNPAVNYYLGTRSEFQRQAAFYDLRSLEREFRQSQALGDVLPEEPTLPSTGHATQFMYYGSYFNTLNAPGSQRSSPTRLPQTGRPR